MPSLSSITTQSRTNKNGSLQSLIYCPTSHLSSRWTFPINSFLCKKCGRKKLPLHFSLSFLQYYVMSSGWCLLTQEWPRVTQRSSNAFRPGEIRNRGYSGWKMASLCYHPLVTSSARTPVLLVGISQKLEASLLRPCKSLTRPIIFVERRTWLEREIVTLSVWMCMVRSICFLNIFSREALEEIRGHLLLLSN